MLSTFFALLRSGLYGTPIPESELPDSIDWKAIMTLAKKQVVQGVIIDSIPHLPEHLRPSEAAYTKMKKFALGLIQANLLLDKAAARLVEFLKPYGIEGVLLKGQGVSRYYRIPQMRFTGDIDFYVGQDQYRRAVELCIERYCKGEAIIRENQQHFGFDMEGIPVEIHRMASRLFSPIGNRHFQQWATEELVHSPGRRKFTVGNTDVTLPSVDFDAVYVFYHAWRHYLEGGIALRQLCDWAMIFHSHSEDIDKERLIRTIKKFGIAGGWKLFACIAVNHLGISPDKMPLYNPKYSKKSEKILDHILSGGNFGWYSEEFKKYKGYGYSGLRYAWEKTVNNTRDYLSLLPVIPVEATFLYFQRQLKGPLNLLARKRGSK